MTVAQRLRLHLYVRPLRWTLLVGAVTFAVVFVVGGWVALAASSP